MGVYQGCKQSVDEKGVFRNTEIGENGPGGYRRTNAPRKASCLEERMESENLPEEIS